MVDTPFNVGDRYSVESLLGRGGMASVYKATDLESGEAVALKLFHEDRATGLPRRRFMQEAQTLRSLSHPAIVRYAAHHGIDASGRPFLAMEWLEGSNLRDVLHGRGLSLQQTLTLAIRLVKALQYLHGEGVVHRDIKPSNIVLVAGQVDAAKIVDFGIAHNDSPQPLTHTGQLMGTPFYMAPEQTRSSARVDGRADVFSLGCVLYESLTGRAAFPADGLLSYLERLAWGEAAPPATVRAEIPASVDRLLARMVARPRELRPFADDGLLETLLAIQSEVASVDLPAVRVEGSPRDEARARLEHPTTHSAQLATPASDGVRADYPTTLPASNPRLLAAPLHPERAAEADSRFVGRERELDFLLEALRPAGAGVLIWGLPGIGKSRLAAEAGSLFVAQRAGLRTVLELDLRDVAGPAALVRRLCSILGTAAPGTQPDMLDHLGRMVRARGEPLVVLDGVEHAADLARNLVASWTRAELGIRILCTARERLNLGPLQDLELGPLSSIAESPTATAPGVALLLGSAGLEPHGLDRQSSEAAARLANMLDGNPLALRLAGPRLAVVGVDAMARSGQTPAELLGGHGTRGARALSEALDGSWELLGEPERQALGECACFSGSFTAAAAEAVLTPFEGAPVVERLQSLRRKSLIVHRATEQGGVRLSLPHAVQEYARTKLAVSDENAVRERRNRYYPQACGEWAREVNQQGSTRALSLLSLEGDNLLAVVDDVLEPPPPRRPDPALALQALLAYDPVASMRGPLVPHIEQLTRALDGAPERSGTVAWARMARGRLLSIRGRFDAGEADLQAAGEMAEQLGDAELRVQSTLELGILHHMAWRFEAAREQYEATLEQVARGEFPMSEGRALANLAAVDHDQGHFEDAAERYEEAIEVLDAVGGVRHSALALANFAVLHQEQGEQDEARRCLEQAVQHFAALGDRRRLGMTVGNLGMLDFEQGLLHAARARHQEAHLLLAEAGDERSQVLAIGRLAAVQACLGNLPQAAAALRKAEQLAVSHDRAVTVATDLQGAFVELARAGRDLERGRVERAAKGLAGVRVRLATAEGDGPNGEPPITEHSDDVRTALRILRPRVSDFEQRLQDGHDAGTPSSSPT